MALPNSRQVRGLKTAGLCGVINPIVVLTLILAAISQSPWFSWTENALSDLGVNGTVAVLFNSSLIIGGILTIIFAVGLGELLKSRTVGGVGALVLLLDGAAMSAIGLFPETTGRLHFYVSVAFFTLLPISLFFIGAALLGDPSERRLGFFVVLAGVFAAAVWMLPWRAVAIPELLASLAASVWSIVLGVKLYRQASLLQLQSR